MKEKLGIIFLHHHIDNVVKSNLESVRKQNPGAVVVTMSAGEKLPGGYSLAKTPKIRKFHSANPKKSSDWLVCSWFVQRRERCAKWWVIEWDVYCTMSAKDYYRPVWKFPFVVSAVRLRYREEEWGWFRHVDKMPEEYRPYAMGGAPFIYLLSEPALEAICTSLIEAPFLAGNGELRFCTVANWRGYPPCGFSPPRDSITWRSLKAIPRYRGIFHPIKITANSD